MPKADAGSAFDRRRDPVRALPPSAAPKLDAAVARAHPRLRLDAQIDVDRVRATLCTVERPEPICFRILLTDPLMGCEARHVGPWCLSFPEGPPRDQALTDGLVQALGTDRDGDFWKVVSPPSGLAWSAGLAIVGWLLALLLCVELIGKTIWHNRPWRRAEGRRVLVGLAALVVLGFGVRHLLVMAGPGNIRSVLPIPSRPPDFRLFGPGLSAWALAWFRLFGADDRVAFLAGAVAGSLTVIPVYCLVHVSSQGHRWAGWIAGLVLALWPIHASLSATDDAAVLIALLLTSAVALVVLAERSGSGWLLVAGWLALGLAATTRPEPALAGLPLGLLILSMPGTRRLQLRPLGLISLGLIMAVVGLVLTFTVTKALQTGISLLASLEPRSVAKLLGLGGGSILTSPRSHWLLTLVFLVGFGASVLGSRGRTALWLLVGFVPALPTAAMAGPNIVTARYQLALVPLAAAVIGVGFAWLHRRALGRWPLAARVGLPLAVAITLSVETWRLLSPAPAPTFRLEYAFFRRNIHEIPADCVLVRPRWDFDLGLTAPTNLTDLLGSGHQWLTLDVMPDPTKVCVVYWQAASCRTVRPNMPAGRLLPDCEQIESGFQLEPVATAQLPARTGFCETYSQDPVPVGLYRLHPVPKQTDFAKPATANDVPPE